MAILWMDGADLCNSNAELGARGWSLGTACNTDPAFVSGEGRNGGNCIKWAAGNTTLSSVMVGGGSNTSSGWCRFSLKVEGVANLAASEANGYFWTIYQGAACGYLMVKLTPTGFTVLRADGNDWETTLGTSTAGLPDNVWTSIGFKWNIDNSAGSFLIKIGATTVLDLTSVDTFSNQNGVLTTWSSPRFCHWFSPQFTGWRQMSGQSANVTMWLDDVVVGDLTGSYNNDLPGDVVVLAKVPTGAGNSSGWTPSAGNNWECVDDNPANSDTDYVSATATGTKDLYTFADVDSGAVIKAVQVSAFARKTGDGVASLAHVVRSNSSDYDSADQTVADTSYAFTKTIHEYDPGSDTTWDTTKLNAAEFGMKKTA